MAGKLCPADYESAPVHGGTGNTSVKPRARDAKAYCEGRGAQQAGAAKNTVPHTDAESKLSWETGWQDAFDGADRGCCAK